MLKTIEYSSNSLVPVKSKFEADIIRFSICIKNSMTYETFKELLAKRHNFDLNFEFIIWYADPVDNELFIIKNDNHFKTAIIMSPNLLRVFVQRKGENVENSKVYGMPKVKARTSIFCGIPKPRIISKPQSRKLSANVDFNILRKTCRRVRMQMQTSNDKHLGLYIKEGQSFRVLPLSVGGGVEQVPGVFISRIVPGGLAESTGLLAVRDEILEVNGIDVLGKTLDQVTDMMIANICNLIITIIPAKESLLNGKLSDDWFSCQSNVPLKSHRSKQNAIVESHEEDIQSASWV